MEGFLFVCVAGLGIWITVQQTQLAKLKSRVDAMAGYLRRHIADGKLPPLHESDPPARPNAQTAEPAAPAPAPEPPPATDWSLAVSQPVVPAAVVEPLLAYASSVPLPTVEPVPEPAARELRSPPAISTWLAENGLAWLGGGALALGGLFLVVYAAQRGVFTPALRLISAAILGAAMIAAGEWVRRQTHAPGGRNLLVAGLLAGAGAATLYGDVWAAHALYQFIPLVLAAAFIAVISLALLAYALVQGEGLAILAILGALVAPALIGPGHWDSMTLNGYLAVILIAGAGSSGLRRWGRAAVVTQVGLAPWALLAMEHSTGHAAVLMLAAPAAAALAALWANRRTSEGAKVDLFSGSPGIALALAAALSLGLWLESATRSHSMTSVALLTISLSLGAGLLSAGRLIKPGFLAAPTVTAILGALMLTAASQHDGAGFYWLVAISAAIAISGFGAGLARRDERPVLLALGGLGAAVFATISWAGFAKTDLTSRALLPALLAGAIAVGAVVLARRSDDPRRDNGLALWIAAAAELAFLALYAAVPLTWTPTATAILALGLAALAVRPGWKGFGQSAVAGGLAVLAVMARPAFYLAASDAATPLWTLALGTALAALLIFAAGQIMRRDPTARREAEAAETAALLAALFAAFLILNRIAAGVGPQMLGPLMMASLRSLLVLSASLLLALRARADDSALVRWRLLVLLAAGTLHAVFAQALIVNPWWGIGETAVGVPALNTLLLSYLAPAVLLGVIARRGLVEPLATRLAAIGAFLFGLLWALLAIRQAWHPAMDVGPVYQAEVCAYAVALMMAAMALIRLRERGSAATSWLAVCAVPAVWFALVVSVLVFWLVGNPWWGVGARTASGVTEALVFLILYLGAAGVALFLFRRLKTVDGTESILSQTALAIGVGHIFGLFNLIVRSLFHGLDPSASGGSGMETWTYSAVWAVFGLAVLMIGAARRNYVLRWIGLVALILSLLKVLVFDTARLEGVIRAGSFLAVGALLVLGAFMVRRLNAGGLLFGRKDVD